MTDYERSQKDVKARNQYGEYRVRYKLDMDDDRFFELNRKYQTPMQDALAAVGVLFEIKNGELKLSLDPEQYVRTKNRHAGRAKKLFAKVDDKYRFYRYSDIVLLMQTMTDQQLAEHIKIPKATFSRHKKAMKESYYYKSLDKDRLTDAEYLQQAPGDLPF